MTTFISAALIQNIKPIVHAFAVAFTIGYVGAASGLKKQEGDIIATLLSSLLGASLTQREIMRARAEISRARRDVIKK